LKFLTSEELFGDVMNKRDVAGLRAAIENALPDLFEESDKAALRDIGAYQKKEITRVFNECVQEFYDNYPPHSYVRKGELFDVLDIDSYRSSSGTYSITKTTDPFDTHAISGREGSEDARGVSEYLYDIVFKKGWHGGADKVSPQKAEQWGEHPNTGAPFWRKPGFATDPESGEKYWHPFGEWHIQADKAKTSPYDAFKKQFDPGGQLDYSAGGALNEEFGRIIDRHSDPVWKKFCKEELPGLVAKYLPGWNK